MKCHYEILGVESQSSESEIKTAYRKLALRWHPDKNIDNPEEAKVQFQLLQQAYEVLSDPQERAWYDKHKDQILRGKKSDYEENCVQIFPYFTASCFKGYSDDEGGFYNVYNKLFEELAAEDAEFMDDPEEIVNIPSFGNSESNYEEVVNPFYAYWQSYCTKKTYSWLCPYDITEIKDRRILREVEKEMKKIAHKARRERNEEVRNLVSFIRKRDRRVQAYKKVLEDRAALNRQKQEQNRLEQIRKRYIEVEEMRNQQKQSFAANDAYEEQLKQLENEYGCSEDDEDESISDDVAVNIENLEIDDNSELLYIDELYCIACNRAFKNENAFLNHEDSKKHKENVSKLKKEMHAEETLYEEMAVCHSEDFNSDEDCNNETKKQKKSKKIKKSLKSSNIIKSENEQDSDIDLLSCVKDNDEDNWDDDRKLGRKTKNKKSGGVGKSRELSNKINKSKDNEPNNVDNTGIPDIDISHNCVTCHGVFESKNKLFAHLKKTNHGVYIPKNESARSKSKKGKKI